jgi:hypothetical protein
MKIRSGFVSNSSSSSFVVIAPKSVVDEVLATLTPYEKAVAEHVRCGTRKFLGQEVSIFQGSQGNSDSWEYCFEYEGEMEPDDNTYDAWTTFTKKLKEKAGEDNIMTSHSDS